VSECPYRIRILDAKALGDPGLLGTAEVSLADAQLQPNAGPRDMWLPLKVLLALMMIIIPQHQKRCIS